MLPNMLKTVITLLVLLLGSVCFVALSVFFGSYVESYAEFQNAPFGFPIPFLYQDLAAQSGYEGGFPHWFDLNFDFLDRDPNFTFIKSNFVYSVLIVFTVFTFLYYRSK